MGYPQEVTSLYPTAKGHSTTMVAAGTLIRLDELIVLEIVGIDHQRAPASTPAQEVMAGIPDDQPQVILPREVKAGFDVVVCPGQDAIDGIESQRTGIAWIGCGTTRLVGPIRPELGRWFIDSRGGRSVTVPPTGTDKRLRHLRPLLIRKVGRGVGALCGIICRDCSKRALERVVADSTGRNVDEEVAPNRGIQRRPFSL